VGNPVAHSLSPQIHRAFAEQTGQRLRYGKLQAPQGGFGTFAEDFFAAAGAGLNVTLPFKGDAFRWVQVVRGAAKRAEAVNTISRERDAFAGYNTDGEGLVRDLRALDLALAGRRVLLIGAGGAAQGVVPALIDAGVAQLTIANRTLARAQRLAARYGANVRSAPLAGLDAGFDLIVNATSAGLGGQGALIDESVATGTVCYDMLYDRDGATPFCLWANEAGAAAVSDGLGMLVEQAGAAFAIWRGVRPDTRKVLEELRHG